MSRTLARNSKVYLSQSICDSRTVEGKDCRSSLLPILPEEDADCTDEYAARDHCHVVGHVPAIEGRRLTEPWIMTHVAVSAIYLSNFFLYFYLASSLLKYAEARPASARGILRPAAAVAFNGVLILFLGQVIAAALEELGDWAKRRGAVRGSWIAHIVLGGLIGSCSWWCLWTLKAAMLGSEAARFQFRTALIAVICCDSLLMLMAAPLTACSA